MNRTTWEIFQGATLSLVRSGALKDRLNDAYRNHLSYINEMELPREVREDFRSFNRTLTRERPLNRSEDDVGGRGSRGCGNVCGEDVFGASAWRCAGADRAALRVDCSCGTRVDCCRGL